MSEKNMKTSAPKINTRLRHNIFEMPKCIYAAIFIDFSFIKTQY